VSADTDRVRFALDELMHILDWAENEAPGLRPVLEEARAALGRLGGPVVEPPATMESLKAHAKTDCERALGLMLPANRGSSRVGMALRVLSCSDPQRKELAGLLPQVFGE
jgi:hypothetical protein